MATLIAAGINTSGKIHQPDLLRSCKRLILVKTVNASGTIVPTSPIFHAREVSETSAIVASVIKRTVAHAARIIFQYESRLVRPAVEKKLLVVVDITSPQRNRPTP